MGQRHQVYVRLPKIDYGNGNANNLPERVIGIHHQWLYGHTAIRLLRNYLTFWEKEDPKYRKTTDGSRGEVLQLAYSFDPERGYVHGVHPFEKDDITIKDPRRGDNNNGITVIDLTGKRPKYAFMSLHGLETLHKSVQHPYDPNDGQELSYLNFTPIDVDHWMKLHYGKNWSVQFRDSKDPANQQLFKEINEWIDFVSSFDLLSVEDLSRIFPDMVTRDEKGLNPTANSVKFIMEDEKIVTKATVGVQKKVKRKTPQSRKVKYAST